MAGTEGELAKAGRKIAKMVTEYITIGAVFKAAMAILKPSASQDPKVIKLTKLIAVLTASSDLLSKISNWLANNASKEVKVKDYVVSLQGVLSKFIPHIGSVSL